MWEYQLLISHNVLKSLINISCLIIQRNYYNHVLIFICVLTYISSLSVTCFWLYYLRSMWRFIHIQLYKSTYSTFRSFLLKSIYLHFHNLINIHGISCYSWYITQTPYKWLYQHLRLFIDHLTMDKLIITMHSLLSELFIIQLHKLLIAFIICLVIHALLLYFLLFRLHCTPYRTSKYLIVEFFIITITTDSLIGLNAQSNCHFTISFHLLFNRHHIIFTSH